jgi:D-alanyl-D-alanine carboxypeptidase (penicillin-binding protein 5/6)
MKGLARVVFPVLFLWLAYTSFVYGLEQEEIDPSALYAKSAVLMDAASGRVLYEKNGEEFLANASTTKIMTCILALELGNVEDLVTVSSYAASMPDVQLNIREGELYRLGDLLYSLMLESHNDSAVAIAEHLAGDCESFAALMQEKAEAIGCENTCFLTPNGLDATQTVTTDDGEQIIREHGTTAKDLALIMRYCIELSPKKEEFLNITQTASYHFSNKIQDQDGTVTDGSRSFGVNNHNSFLGMMEGALSGKTGFTGKAGYCYVGALQREGRTFIVALLACGWPGNRSYKWSDTRKLMNYGLENYQLHRIEEIALDWEDILISPVAAGQTEELDAQAYTALTITGEEDGFADAEVLLKEGELLRVEVTKEELTAPVEKGQRAGRIDYYIGDKLWLSKELVTAGKTEKKDFYWCMKMIFKRMAI